MVVPVAEIPAAENIICISSVRVELSTQLSAGSAVCLHDHRHIVRHHQLH